MSFFIKNDEVWEKYKQTWDVVKNKLGIKSHSEPIYKQKYLKSKVREFYGVIKTDFMGIYQYQKKYALCLHYLHKY